MVAPGPEGHPPSTYKDLLESQIKCTLQRSQLWQISYNAFEENSGLKKKVRELVEYLTELEESHSQLGKDYTSVLQEHLQVLNSHAMLDEEHKRL